MNAVPKSEYVTVPVAARFILGISQRAVSRMCQEGKFKTAIKPGTNRGQWRIKREEVEAHLNRHIEE